MPLIGAVGARSTLRDSMRRLGEIRVACGKGDAQGGQQSFQPTGDPFGDRMQWFRAHAHECSEAIDERARLTGARTPEERTQYVKADADVVGSIDKMKLDLQVLEKLVSEANAKYFEAQQKQKPQERIDAKLKTLNERTASMREAQAVYDRMKVLARKTKEETLVASRSQGKSKTRIRAAMETLRKAQSRNIDTGNAQTQQELEALYANAPYAAEEAVPTLEQSEYRDQYMRIQQQKREIDAGLDRLSEAITRIRHQMVSIGDELETQKQLLQETHERVAQQADNVAQLRKSVDNVLKKQAPMNMCINVFCFILLLALVGYFLVKFRVV